MAQEIGSLIVSLRANSAQFSAEMDRARKGMKGAGTQADASSRQIAKLAADGFGAVLPISLQAENAIERFIQKSLKAEGAIGALAKATLLLGAGFAAFKLGSFIGEFAALGSSVKTYEENIKKATEEQKKFSADMNQRRDSVRSLAKELATLRGEQEKALKLDQAARESALLKDLGGARGPAALKELADLRSVFAEQDRKLLQDRSKARDESDQKILDDMQKLRDEQVKTWTEETTALKDALATRLKMRQDFEAQLGQGGLPGQGAAGGLAAVRRLKEQLEKEGKDLAFLEREGLISQTDATSERENIRTRAIEEAKRLKVEFGGLPVVLDAVDKAIDSVEFGNFGREMAKARGEVQVLVPTLDGLKTAGGQLAAHFANMPAAVDPASQAVRQLTQDYHNLTNAIHGSTGALIANANAAAGGAALPNTGARFVGDDEGF